MKKKLYTSLIFFLLAGTIMAQDPQYSQFYAAPMYLNPALAGANSCSRVATSYRMQWPGIPGKFNSFVASFDHCLPQYNSAYGLIFTKDQAGSGALGGSSASGIYAYQLNLTRKWTVNVGFQGTYASRSVNFYDLYFVDQLLTGSATTVEKPFVERINYFDLSSGVVAFSQTSWWGFAAHHMTTPNQGVHAPDSKLPVKYSFHAGRSFALRNSAAGRRKIAEQNFTPAINYKQQGKFKQLDLGAYLTYEPVVLGIWYRGIPVLDAGSENSVNHDGIIFTAGFSKETFTLGYSYDITLSRLSSTTRGSHEISLSYNFCDYKSLKKKRKVLRFVPCAKF